MSKPTDKRATAKIIETPAELPRPVATIRSVPPVVVELPDVVSIELPLGEVSPDWYVADLFHVDVSLKPDEAKAFRRLQEGLRTRGCRLRCGRPVSSRGDVLRYLLQLVCEAK